MPEVRQQIAISDGAVKRPPRRLCQRFGGAVVPGRRCGPMIEAAPFPVRPDSVRPADLLGPYDGIVVDADSDRPIAGATVSASWAFERGIGFHAPAGAHEVRGRDRRRRPLLGAQARRPAGAARRRASGASPSSSTTAATSPGAATGCSRAASRAATSASAAAACGSSAGSPRCATPSTSCSWAAARRCATVAAWELQAAALELEGRQVPAARGEGEPALRRRPRRSARHREAADRRGDPRRDRLRGQVRGRQADGPADDRVLRQPALPGGGQGGELRRRPAGLAPRHRRGRGAVSRS